MAKKRIIGGGTQEVNMTPMIDCTFQLIIFFILTAQMANQELAKVSLPEPVKSMATAPKPEEGGQAVQGLNKVTVNVVNKYGDKNDNRQMDLAGKAEYYQLGKDKINAGDTEALTAAIKTRKQQLLSDKKLNLKENEIMVEIRADKDIAFQDIEPVMRAAAEAKITKMSMTALVDPEHRVQP